MPEIIALLSSLSPFLARTQLNQLILIVEAIIAMSGQVTMLGISRWTEKGGSYRTIQRFFSTEINWPLLKWQLVRIRLKNKKGVKIIAGDHTTVTKSGKQTHGIGRFFLQYLEKQFLALNF